MSEIQNLSYEYVGLLNRQQFDGDTLDYSIVEKHKVFLQHLSTVGNSGITVFDLYRKEHVFTSYNFSDLFGYDLDEIEKRGSEYFDSRIHPEDLLILMKNGISLLKLFYELPFSERTDYKFINEYRIQNKYGQYVRVIEQHQALEQDSKGNIWLVLCVIDISPNQEITGNVKSQFLNYKTGEILPFTFPAKGDKTDLTKREVQILQMVKDGLLSKEISDRLSISFHTVNTHRQRILEKLGASNSLEAVSYASRLGLLR